MGLRAKSVGLPLKNGPDTVGAKLDENCNIVFIWCVQCILIFKLNMYIVTIHCHKHKHTVPQPANAKMASALPL